MLCSGVAACHRWEGGTPLVGLFDLKISLLSFHIPFSQSKLHAPFCLAPNSALFR